HVAHHQLGRQTLERFLGWRRLTRGHTNRSCESMLRREGRNVSPPRHPVNDVAYGADTLRPAGAAGVWRAQPVTTHMNSTDWYHLFSAIHDAVARSPSSVHVRAEPLPARAACGPETRPPTRRPQPRKRTKGAAAGAAAPFGGDADGT